MQSLLNISIDDVSPHPKSSISVVKRCFELIDVFPDIKFSLFVPVSYWRTVRREIATPQPLQINLYPEFCESLRKIYLAADLAKTSHQISRTVMPRNFIVCSVDFA